MPAGVDAIEQGGQEGLGADVMPAAEVAGMTCDTKARQADTSKASGRRGAQERAAEVPSGSSRRLRWARKSERAAERLVAPPPLGGRGTASCGSARRSCAGCASEWAAEWLAAPPPLGAQVSGPPSGSSRRLRSIYVTPRWASLLPYSDNQIHAGERAHLGRRPRLLLSSGAIQQVDRPPEVL